ncbi:MAG: hypothetical protein K0R93_3701 [Anaerosolibacter sp.]|jgi:hypothetical protein|uniref:Rho termination factor N-terminal domain-containing protein n=1 Tax=Anaerosolibacter sp. TaxID=1872527 RepID=UPI00262B16AC|nr:Rho termination factor N-terminal domain-containing protein [Anaerosolibacter sp.]MDF2548803.1 hypothetical protein [Anaerosolibacter sp.]
MKDINRVSLNAIAKKLGIKRYTKMKKDELIKYIEEHFTQEEIQSTILEVPIRKHTGSIGIFKSSKAHIAMIGIIVAIITLIVCLPPGFIGAIQMVDFFQNYGKPDDLNKVPFLSYTYDSNYHYMYLFNEYRTKNALSSFLEVTNISELPVSNLEIGVYLFDVNEQNNENYFQVHNVNDGQYKRIFHKSISKVSSSDSFKINIDEILLDYCRNNFKNYHTDQYAFLFPNLGEKHFIDRAEYVSQSGNYIFTEDTSVIEYDQQSELRLNKYDTNNYTGFKIKIIISYTHKNIDIKELLFGGLYYFSYNQDNYFIPKAIVVDSFSKAPYSMWKRADEMNYKKIKVVQDILHAHSSDKEADELGLFERTCALQTTTSPKYSTNKITVKEPIKYIDILGHDDQ